MMCTGRYILPEGRNRNPAAGTLVPCGGCLACRINKQNEWTKRIMDECSFHASNTFLTLTYCDDLRPQAVNTQTGEVHYNIVKKDFSVFIHSLRKNISRSSNPHKIMYFTSAEYGTLSRHCHFHSILFGYNPNAANVRRIQRVWHKGFVRALPVLDGGAEYCAKHQTKYDNAVPDWVNPPCRMMSTKPAIGLRWILAHPESISHADHLGAYVKFGKKRQVWLPAPRYYMSKVFTDEEIKRIRKDACDKQIQDMYAEYPQLKTESDVRTLQQYRAELGVCDLMWQRKYGNKRRDKI